MSYTKTAKALHWLMAALLFGLLGIGFYMHDLPLSPEKLQLYSWHKWAGVTIFLLSAARLLWRLAHPAPALPAATPTPQPAAEPDQTVPPVTPTATAGSASWLTGLATALPAALAFGAGGPENALVVVNADSWASVCVANEYVAARHIPAWAGRAP